MKIQNTLDLGSDGIKIVVAGEAGNGKTTLARTLVEGLKNEKVCIISAEAGLLSLRGVDIDVIDIQRDDAGEPIPKEQRLTRLGEVYHWLTEKEQVAKYRWIFIDSLTELNQNMLERLEADPEYQGPKNTIKKFGELSTRMRSLSKNFRDLPHYNIVFTALVKEAKDNDGKTSIAIDMIGAFAAKLPALFDEIFYLGVLSEVDELTGRNKRGILTQKTDKLTFPKDRSGTLDKLEPADLAAIVKKIRAKAGVSPSAAATNPEPGKVHQAPAPVQVSATPPTQPQVAAEVNANGPAAPLVADISATAKAAAAEVKAQKQASQ